MAQQFANAARAELAAHIGPEDTQFTLVRGYTSPPQPEGENVGLLFPTADGESWFKLVLQSADGMKLEIVYCFLHDPTTDTFGEILRGQEGTSPQSFDAGTTVGLRPTAGDAETVRDGLKSLAIATEDLYEATQVALATKVDKVEGKGLSEEDFSTAEKLKLADIEEGAQVNPIPVTNLASTDNTLPLAASQGRVLKGFIDNINAVLQSDDSTLDELQEIVNFIKMNRATLETLGIDNIAGLVDALAEKVDTSDSRLTNSREWTATTMSQAEAEAGTATTRRAVTAQRIRQAILGWWNNSTEKTALDNTVRLTGAQTIAGTKAFKDGMALDISPTNRFAFVTAIAGQYFGSSTTTGCIAIKLPAGSNTFVDAEIVVNSAYHLPVIVEMGGYTRVDNNDWTNIFARVKQDRNFVTHVRFARDAAGHSYLLLGNTSDLVSSSWVSYMSAYIARMKLGWSGADTAQWKDGSEYSMSLITSLSNFTYLSSTLTPGFNIVGSEIKSLNASNLSSGTVADARLPGTLNNKTLSNPTLTGTITGLGTAATKNITASTAAPSGGNDGDIWLRYE